MRTNNTYVIAHYTAKGRILAKDSDGEVLKFASAEDAHHALMNIHYPLDARLQCKIEVENDG